MVELVGTVRPNAYRDAFMRALSFHQISLGAGLRNGRAGLERLLAAGRQVSKLLEEGAIHVPRLETLALDDARDALMAMRSQRTVGKRVVLLSS